LQTNEGHELKLASTLWPIVHAAPQNPGSVKGSLEVSRVAFGNARDALQRAQPVSVIKGPNDIWWTSGVGSVYALEVRNHGRGRRQHETIEVIAEFQRPEGFTTFHGAYAFVDSDGFFYAAFESSVERFQLDNRGTIIRERIEFSQKTTWIAGDKFVAYNLSPSGFMILCTFAGNVFVSSTGCRMGAGEFTNITWRNLNLQPTMLQTSATYRQFVQSHGDGSLFVANSIGMGVETEVAFVPTAWGVITVNVDEQSPRAVSFWDIRPFLKPTVGEGWFLTRLGPFGVGASPTTFDLKGTTYVTVTDGQVEPMNLHVAQTTAAFIHLPFKSVGVKFGDSKFSTSEQSISVMVTGDEAHLVVVNNYVGINSFDVEDPNIWSVHEEHLPDILHHGNNFLSSPAGQKALSTGSAQKTVPLAVGACSAGVNLYVFDGESIRLRWSNVDVSSLTGIPLQTEDRVWIVGTERPQKRRFSRSISVGPISLFALDRRTGQIVVRAPLPDSEDAAKDGVIEDFIRNAIQSLPVIRQAVALENYLNRTFNNIFYAGLQTDGEAVVFGSIAGVNRAVQA
jgi:hypothetical protein